MSTLDATVSMLEAMPEESRSWNSRRNCSLPGNPQTHLSQSAQNRFFQTLPNPATRLMMGKGSTWQTH